MKVRFDHLEDGEGLPRGVKEGAIHAILSAVSDVWAL